MSYLPKRFCEVIALLAFAPAFLTPWIVRGQKAVGMNEGETVADAAVPENSAMAEISDVPGLPRVLLIGDSISISYTLPVRKLLEGKANVHRIPLNGQTTAFGLKQLDRWLGTGKWDVIHFNFGLWDAKYKIETSAFAVSREDYAKNLTLLAQRLRNTGAQVVFATTTPVPAVLEPPGRRFDDIPERNAIAVRTMKENKIAVNDLYASILPDQELTQRPKDVHFNAKGSAVLAESVARSIIALLPRK